MEPAINSNYKHVSDLLVDLRANPPSSGTPNRNEIKIKIYQDPFLRDVSQLNSLNAISGVFSYIEQFGFFNGGGEQNPYRVDPRKVISVITGK